MSSPTFRQLQDWCERGELLRQQADTRSAEEYLAERYASILESGMLDGIPETQKDVECRALACEVVRKYAAVCTQRAFRLNRESYHMQALDIELEMYRCACRTLEHVVSGLNFASIEREKYLIANSLGVSYQRPKRLFRRRDTQRAVRYSFKAASHFLPRAFDKIIASDGCLDAAERAFVLDAIRYCNNHATALYQRGEDCEQEGDSAVATAWYDHSRRYREMFERDLIDRAFGKECLRYLHSLTQHAAIDRAKARCGCSGCFERARETYEDVIRQLACFEQSDKTDATGGCSESYRVARMNAQFGLARCLLDAGELDDAWELLRETRDERELVLGANHLDTRKSVDETDRAVRAIWERDHACREKRKGWRRG